MPMAFFLKPLADKTNDQLYIPKNPFNIQRPMKIIAYFITYNEISLLPLQHKWCKNRALGNVCNRQLLNDGTVSYLKKNNIRHQELVEMDSPVLQPIDGFVKSGCMSVSSS